MSETLKERLKRELATAYSQVPDEFYSINKTSLFVLKQVINHQYQHLVGNLGFSFYFNDYEPYGTNPKIADVKKDFHSGWLEIHTTGNESEVWGAFTNLQFRAIHDYVHCMIDAEFDHESEKKVLEAQIGFAHHICGEKFSYADWDLYFRILRSEIVYQSAYKEVHGEFHINQKIVLSDL